MQNHFTSNSILTKLVLQITFLKLRLSNVHLKTQTLCYHYLVKKNHYSHYCMLMLIDLRVCLGNVC